MLQMPLSEAVVWQDALPGVGGSESEVPTLF